jgi:hypothetical protein
MSKRKKDEETETSKPFFARYLEGQHTEASEAKVGGSRSLSYKKASPAQTMKAPSDSDELLYCPYYQTLADIPEKYQDAKLMTLKYPSDRDEWVFNAEYTSKAQVPKGNVTAKEGTVKLKKSSTLKKK